MKKIFTTLLLTTLLFNMSNSSTINKKNDFTKNNSKEILTKSKQYEIKNLEGFAGW